ncbi:MAG: MBL fold metallo-hydrolase [Polaromonas sp.]|nr:MAG: MBL fold metallo-hydrolase [Polaromonas sp.]
MLQFDLPAGVHVFERGWLSANNILFVNGDETLLVDSGYCTHSAQTLLLIEQALIARPLDVLVNTHLHSDHCGGNAMLQARYPAIRTLIPPGYASHVTNWNPIALTYLPTGQLCPQFGFNKMLEPGTSIRFGLDFWEIHAAPGHDPHSVVFFEPQSRVLISADAMWEKGFGVVFPELEGEKAFDEVSATLDLIERLKPLVVIPGHGRVFSYTSTIMNHSREKLNAFVQSPPRHASHAAKVLLKFKLLEVQRQTHAQFMKWAIETPYLVSIHARFFGDMTTLTWITRLCDELIKAGVAKMDGTFITNV